MMKKVIVFAVCLLSFGVKASDSNVDNLRNIVKDMSSIAMSCNTFAGLGQDLVTAKLNGKKKEDLPKSANDSVNKVLDEAFETNMDASQFRDYYFTKCINESRDKLLNTIK